MSWLVRFGDSSIRPDIDVPRDCSLTNTSINQLLRLLNKIDEAVCVLGMRIPNLVSSHKGNFKDSSGKYNSEFNMYVLFLTGTQVVAGVNPRLVPATIRHAQCSILVPTTTPRCARCTEYRHSLRSMRARSTKPPEEETASSSHINYRYLSTPEKLERMKTLHRTNRAARMKIERLKVKLKNAIDNKGVSLDREVTYDLHQVMEEEEEKAMSDVQPGSFRHIFWQQQHLGIGEACVGT